MKHIPGDLVPYLSTELRQWICTANEKEILDEEEEANNLLYASLW